MFWCAPEHLAPTQNEEKFSFKGDVYSFGIILYEVAVRSLPYSTYHSVSPEGMQLLSSILYFLLLVYTRSVCHYR